jgi:hypothetical protein
MTTTVMRSHSLSALLPLGWLACVGASQLFTSCAVFVPEMMHCYQARSTVTPVLL